MIYRITIDEVHNTDEVKYPEYKEVYQQIILDINIPETVKFLNRRETAKVGSIQNPTPFPLGGGITYC